MPGFRRKYRAGGGDERALGGLPMTALAPGHPRGCGWHRAGWNSVVWKKNAKNNGWEAWNPDLDGWGKSQHLNILSAKFRGGF